MAVERERNRDTAGSSSTRARARFIAALYAHIGQDAMEPLERIATALERIADALESMEPEQAQDSTNTAFLHREM